MNPKFIVGIGGIPKAMPFISAAENKRNTQSTIKNWMLGPENPSQDPKANAPYWKKLGEVMGVSESESRRRRCSSCEYYDNSTQMQEKMERIPLNQYDENAGFRGFCHKFDFICHDMRSCQAWEK